MGVRTRRAGRERFRAVPLNMGIHGPKPLETSLHMSGTVGPALQIAAILKLLKAGLSGSGRFIPTSQFWKCFLNVTHPPVRQLTFI